MTNTLPENYESLIREKLYWSPSKMKEGDNRFRIVQRPIAGWIDWKDNKPHRWPGNAKPKHSFDPAKPMKPFWACHVWDYDRENLYILEITQSSLLKAIVMIATDSEWGDFTQYDLKINKQGSGKETRYGLTPIPPKPLAEPIKAAMKASPVRLEALYEGKDPWIDLEPSATVNVTTGEIKNVYAGLSEKQCEELKVYLDEDKTEEGKIKSILRINNVYSMTQEDFPKIIKTLKGHQEARRNGKEKVVK